MEEKGVIMSFLWMIMALLLMLFLGSPVLADVGGYSEPVSPSSMGISPMMAPAAAAVVFKPMVSFVGLSAAIAAVIAAPLTMKLMFLVALFGVIYIVRVVCSTIRPASRGGGHYHYYGSGGGYRRSNRNWNR